MKCTGSGVSTAPPAPPRGTSISCWTAHEPEPGSGGRTVLSRPQTCCPPYTRDGVPLEMTALKARSIPAQGQTALATVGRSDSPCWNHRLAGGSREHHERGRNSTSGSRSFPEVEESYEALMQDQNSPHLLKTLNHFSV